jgi:hypothetical protein
MGQNLEKNMDKTQRPLGENLRKTRENSDTAGMLKFSHGPWIIARKSVRKTHILLIFHSRIFL